MNKIIRQGYRYPPQKKAYIKQFKHQYILVVQIILIGLFVYVFLKNDYTEILSLLAQKSALSKAYETKEKDLLNLDTNLSLIDASYKTHQQKTPLKDETAAILHIFTLMKDAPLDEINIEIIARRNTDDSYLRPISLSATGPYDKCIAFIAILENSIYPINIDSVNMQSKDQDLISLSIDAYISLRET